MMASDRQQLTQLDAQSLDISALAALAPARRIVVFLPDDPLGLLTTLQQAAVLLDQSAAPLPMLILSRCPDRWLWHTLGHLVTRRSLLSEIRVAASDLPTRCIAAQLRGHGFQEAPFLMQRAEKARLVYGKPAVGLSKPELNAILDLLHGYNIMERAQQQGISQKTLYNQRTSGLKKMAEHHPKLAAHFPGNPETRQNRSGINPLSPSNVNSSMPSIADNSFRYFNRLLIAPIDYRVWKFSHAGVAMERSCNPVNFCHRYAPNTPGRY